MPDRPVIAILIDSDEIMRVVIELTKKKDWVPLDLMMTGADPLSWMPPRLALAAVHYTGREIWNALARTNCQTVLMGWQGWADVPSPLAWPMVWSAGEDRGRLAAEHFFERGFSSLGYVGYDPWGGHSLLYEAFAERSGELGVSCHLLRLKIPDAGVWQPDRKWRLSQFKAWIESVPKPIGILCWGVRGGTVLCELCHLLGLSVPDDVAILVAADNSARAECAPVPLSCIGVDHAGMARAAIEILSDMLAGRDAPLAPVLIPPKSIWRESTSVLAVQNRDVARALRYIWSHLDLDLGVDQIAEAVGVPVRTLQRGFEQELGRGVNVELRRKRLERVCELLRTTDLNISTIGLRVGIRSRNHLHASFRKAYGMSPREYRLLEQVPRAVQSL